MNLRFILEIKSIKSVILFSTIWSFIYEISIQLSYIYKVISIKRTVNVLRLISEIEWSPRKNVANPGSVKAAADRIARTKMMAVLFCRFPLQSQSYADASKRGLSRYSCGRESSVFRAEFSPRATDREWETNDAEDPNGKKRREPLNATTFGVDARRKATRK